MLAVVTLKKIWKNEYIQTAIMIALMVGAVFGLWYGSQLVLNTEYPALAVVSTSMLPTLNVGDVIIVQGVNAIQINADYYTGDIVVFRDPSKPDYRIVHRAVKIENTSNGYWITTRGDNVGGDKDQFSPWHESFLIGKVIARVPYVGNFSLLLNAYGTFYYFVFIIIIIINIILSLVFSSEKDKTVEEPKKPEKINIGTIFFIIFNVLLIGFALFSVIGSFTFWQIGAEPPQYVTIRGMYTDLQYQATYKPPQSNINGAFLYPSIFTYQIDCLVNGNIRTGVPTFSWLQASILVLVVYDLWELNKKWHLGEKLKQRLSSLYK